MISALGAAAGGLSTAMARFDASAAEAASLGAGPGTDVVSAMTGTTVAAVAVEANAAVLRTTLDTQGALIDVLA